MLVREITLKITEYSDQAGLNKKGDLLANVLVKRPVIRGLQAQFDQGSSSAVLLALPFMMDCLGLQSGFSDGFKMFSKNK